MKPELSEQLFIEELFKRSKDNCNEINCELKNIERLTGDASTRRYYRLYCGDTSFVACLDNPTEEGFNTFVNMQEFLVSHKVRVPHIYSKDLTKGYLLEEDLGDVTLLQKLTHIKNSEEEYKIYKDIIDILLQMHQIPIDENTLSKVELKFDYDKLISEIEFTEKFFFKIFLGVKEEKHSRDLINFFSPICKRISAEKMVYTHRDFHSRNVMVKNNDNIVIDFQDARLGIPQYDLVSLLEDCYYDLDPKNKEKLIKYYFDKLGSDTHRQESLDNFMSLYNDMLLQRVFKAIGSFAYIYETRKDVRYVKYIGFAMEKIRKIMLSDSKYDDLRKLLFGIYYES
jgi:aminoglycoside/choline kinase family phosphotransferase